MKLFDTDRILSALGILSLIIITIVAYIGSAEPAQKVKTLVTDCNIDMTVIANGSYELCSTISDALLSAVDSVVCCIL